MVGVIEKYRRRRSWAGKIFNRGNSGSRINSGPPLFVARPRDRKSNWTDIRTVSEIEFGDEIETWIKIESRTAIGIEGKVGIDIGDGSRHKRDREKSGS
ncbi:hypothetical protein EVAR_103099_1 [Eumeta japonica]|uniref:Uncharacterized protein n=1 Tax=Eumeta variegata TaxID=151549 RepID=A0A4C1WRC7_EUMVA|nr:hypothetical protein EVAR_103099_1 [Eumeta japonica]